MKSSCSKSFSVDPQARRAPAGRGSTCPRGSVGRHLETIRASPGELRRIVELVQLTVVGRPLALRKEENDLLEHPGEYTLGEED